jgi:superfamily II DNA or RNA helicase
MTNLAIPQGKGNVPVTSGGGVTPIVLRDYQTKGMDMVRRAFGSRQPDGAATHSVLLVAPTGAGKGTLAAYALTEGARKGRRSLFVVHRREILRDQYGRLLKAGAPCGMILPGEPYDPDALIQVCSVQTLFARGHRPPADFVFWDEAHHAAARSYRDIRNAYPKAKHLGASATPQRGDRTALGDVFQEMIVIASPSELTARGFLVPCAAFAPDHNLGENLAQDPVQAYIERGEGKRAFVFTDRRVIANDIAERFRQAGIDAVAIDAKTPEPVRRLQLEMFRRGQIRIVVNVNTMTEGVDIPEAKVCILAKKCATLAVYLQAVGRVLRPAEGEGNAILIDLCGNLHIHKLPGDDRLFSLTGKPISNVEEEAEDELLDCPAGCGATVRSMHIAESGPGCPGCGWKREARPMAAILDERLHAYGEQLPLPFAVNS